LSEVYWQRKDGKGFEAELGLCNQCYEKHKEEINKLMKGEGEARKKRV